MEELKMVFSKREKATDLPGTDSPSNEAGTAGADVDALPTSLLQVKEKAKRARKKRAPIVDDAAQAQVKELFSERTLRPVAELPFNVLAVATHSDAWNLEEDEAMDIARPCAMLANLYLPEIDPKTAAMIAIALALSTIGSVKAMQYYDERKNKMRAAKAKPVEAVTVDE